MKTFSESAFTSIQKIIMKVNKMLSLVFSSVSYFLGRGIILVGTSMRAISKICFTKSMIDLMKNLKTDVVEKTSTESVSSAFETLFREHWAHVYRLLNRLVGDPRGRGSGAGNLRPPLSKIPGLSENDFNPGWLHPRGDKPRTAFHPWLETP